MKNLCLFSVKNLIKIDVRKKGLFNWQFYVNTVFEDMQGDNNGFWERVCCSEDDSVNTTGIKFLVVSNNYYLKLFNFL